MRTPRVLIKIGGAALAESAALANVTHVVQAYRDLGYDVILVHGGGPAINEELRRRGIEWTFVNGQRVTTPLMMKTIEDTLCGNVNGKIVRHLNHTSGVVGLSAIGFSGADNRTLLCSAQSAELGLVGKIEEVNTAWIEEVLSIPSKPLPVIAPIGVGVNGESFNINADRAAAFLAVGLKVDELIFLTDQPGIYDEEGEIIRTVDAEGLNNLIDAKIVTGGMLAKTQAVLHALNNGVSSVKVTNARNDSGTASVGLRHVAI